MNTEKIIEAYRAEYLRTNGKPINVSYAKGWVIIKDGFTGKYRRADIIEFTERLKTRTDFIKQ